MRYLLGLLLPALVQTLIVWVVIQQNTGNGSFAGLGALLIGMFAIPATAILNGIYLYSHRQEPGFTTLTRCWLISLLTPVLVVFTLLA